MQPDADLSTAALDVRHELEELARQYPDAEGPELVLRLARRYILVRLRRGDRRDAA